MAQEWQVDGEWFTTSEAARYLEISKDCLKELAKTRILRPGKHWRNISRGKKRPTYRFNVAAIEDFFAEIKQ